MAVEAQRLITVSLGKIAASRTQRGGINLHKNLLVASVLHKAKKIYVLENFQQHMMANKIEQPQSEYTSQITDQETVIATRTIEQCNSSSDDVSQLSYSARETGSRTEPCVSHADKENTPPPENTVLVGSTCLKAEPIDVCQRSGPDENNRTKAKSQVTKSDSMSSGYVISESDCRKCVKRRLSGQEVNNDDASVSKKIRSEDSYFSEQTTTQCEAMQLDSPQMTSLVSIFNHGFSGLCNGSLDMCSDKTHHHVTALTPHQDNTISSCAIQVNKDNRSIDLVPMTTVMALTV